MGGVQAVEQIADPVVAGDLLHAEERVAIGAGGCLLHAPLEFEEGGGLQEEHREGAGSSVGGGVARVAAPAGIRQRSAGPAEGVQQTVQNIVHSSCIEQCESLC